MEGDCTHECLRSPAVTSSLLARRQVYASYGARYEGRIVQRMIQNDGGKGLYEELTPPMLGIWETLLNVSHVTL